jgi:uncharacterized phiE125 gp8 family phage protein
MKFRVLTPPAVEPITLDEARTHLRIEPYGSPEEHPDDLYIQGLITAARQWCEEYTRLALATQTIEVAFDNFSELEDLPFLPAQSIDGITYVDGNGANQTLATSVYGLDLYTGGIVLKYGQSWPATRAESNAVIATYKAGYTVGESPDEYTLPGPIKSAMYLIIGHMYENRQQVGTVESYELQMGVFSLLQPYRRGLGI